MRLDLTKNHVIFAVRSGRERGEKRSCICKNSVLWTIPRCRSEFIYYDSLVVQLRKDLATFLENQPDTGV